MRPMLPLAACAALGLAGCASDIDGPLSPAFGSALASMDAQIIDPTPAKGAPESSGARAAIGLQRYQEHRVTEPPGAYTEKTVQLGSGDKSGGSQNGDSKDGDKK